MFKTTVRGALAAAAILFGGASVAEAATQVEINSVGMYQPQAIILSGPGVETKQIFATALKIEGTNPGGNTTFWAFCVDIWHAISFGYNFQRPVDLTYEYGVLSNDFGGNPLSADQVGDLQDLAGYGLSLIGTAEPDLDKKLAAVQVALWRIEYPTLTFNAYNAAINAYATGYVAGAGSYGKSSVLLFDVAGKSQGVLVPGDGGTIGVPGVPEPGTWALMIVGLGAVGYSLRRRALVTA